MLRLYKISQNVNNGWDTFDSAIVAAYNWRDARLIHPNKRIVNWPNPEEGDGDWIVGNTSWCDSPNQVKTDLIGQASPDIKRGVILASFNAG
jgi:hypothetical protein